MELIILIFIGLFIGLYLQQNDYLTFDQVSRILQDSFNWVSRQIKKLINFIQNKTKE